MTNPKPISIIQNTDCVEAMKQYPDNFFDLAVCDPPYGISIGANKNFGKRKKTQSFTNYKKSDWDNAIPEKSYFDEVFRVSKNQIFWGGNYFTEFLQPTNAWIIWDKKMSKQFSFTFSTAELAWTSFLHQIKTVTVSKGVMQNCISSNAQKAIDNENRKIHPTQKPIQLYEWILENYAKEGDKILDTHLGSGSSRIAA